MSEQQQNVEDVAAEVQKHLDSWNAPVDNSGVTHLVGEQSHRDTGLTPASSTVDAGRPDEFPEAFAGLRGGGQAQASLPEVPTDDDGNPQYDDMSKRELKAHLEARGLPTSGNKGEMVERMEEYDAGSAGNDEDDDEDDNV